jgi:hypothetical protein
MAASAFCDSGTDLLVVRGDDLHAAHVSAVEDRLGARIEGGHLLLVLLLDGVQPFQVRGLDEFLDGDAGLGHGELQLHGHVRKRDFLAKDRLGLLAELAASGALGDLGGDQLLDRAGVRRHLVEDLLRRPHGGVDLFLPAEEVPAGLDHLRRGDLKPLVVHLL